MLARYSQKVVEQAKRELLSSRSYGLDGAILFDSGRDGPFLYAGVFTHGNEPMTVAILAPLLQREIAITSGKVCVVMNNIDAARSGRRAIDNDPFGNFNRMDPNILDSSGTDLASVRRMRQIADSGLLCNASHGFDAHTNNTLAGPTKLHIKGSMEFAENIPVNPMITNIVNHQSRPGTKPTVAFGNFIGGIDKNVPVVELEGGGPHDAEDVIHHLIDGFVAVLARLGMIDIETHQLQGTQEIFDVIGATWAPGPGYMYIPRHLSEGALVQKGMNFLGPMPGRSGSIIVAPYDFHALMIGRYGEEEPMDDVVCFNAVRREKVVTFFTPKHPTE